MNQSAHGFTIVELLIVIVVVAILAALSYVGYTAISNRAHDSVIVSDLSNFAKAANIFYAENGTYPSVAEIGSDVLKLKPTKSSYDTVGYNLYYCTDAPRNGGSHSKFGFAAKSKSGKNFYASSVGSGVASAGNMFAGYACDPIGVGQVSGNLQYAYNRTTGTWSSWAN